MAKLIVGVVGLGLLGRGIAACLLGHGARVVGICPGADDQEAASREIAQALGELDERHPKGTPFPGAEWRSRYTTTADWVALATCDFVIESVPERLETKQAVFDQIEAVVAPGTTIASNTSAIPITALQRGRRHPERFLGMHWAEPAHATRFLELIRGEATGDSAVGAAAAMAAQLGKEPCVVQRDVPGFLVNRLAYAIYREALHLLETGVADADTIDRAFRNAAGLWATLCGPLRWIDLTGGPVLYAQAMEPVLPDLSTAKEVPSLLRSLAESGARGISNGRGFYDYTPSEAQDWRERYRRHAWTASGWLDANFPLQEGSR